MALPGQNKGNQHAAKKPGERKRAAFTVSLSGERLAHLISYLKVTDGREEVTDQQIAEASRHMIEEWIDNLQI